MNTKPDTHNSNSIANSIDTEHSIVNKVYSIVSSIDRIHIPS
jgi:hypothetical protein